MNTLITFLNGLTLFLEGKKTYILGGLVLLTAYGQAIGSIDVNTANLIYAILGGGSVITVRSAITKLQAQLPA